MKLTKFSKFSIEKHYVARLDARHRLTIKASHSQQFIVTQYGNGCIALEPASIQSMVSPEESEFLHKMVSKTPSEPVKVFQSQKK